MTHVRFPLAQPSFDEQEVEALRRVLADGWVVQGPAVEAFERDVAGLHHLPHGVAVSSGTAALHILFAALGVGRGDVVFVPSFAWPAAANMALQVRAIPVFVDVLPRTYNLSPEDLCRQIDLCTRHGWGRPRVVVAVHEFGLAADMTAVQRIARENQLLVLEDAACALGATYRGTPVGHFGTAAIFSFHPRKSVTTGEGGVIVTADADLADRCRVWRNHGQQPLATGGRDFTEPGFNYRLTEMQGAMGRVQMTKFPRLLQRRRELVAHYQTCLRNVPGLVLPEESPEHTWQTYMPVLDSGIDRAEVIRVLADAGIGAGPGAVAAHVFTVFKNRAASAPPELPVSVRLAEQGLALPLYGALTVADVEVISQAVRRTLTS